MEKNEGKAGWWEKPWLSNREWIFVIVILGLIGYVSLLHHKSVNALGYVSFAGTIVSIIVGVLAIIYAMLESVRQSESGDRLQAGAASIKKAAGTIGSKIEAMENVALEITHAKEELSKASETTNKLILDTLQQFSAQFDHLHQSHSNLDSQIAKIESIHKQNSADASQISAKGTAPGSSQDVKTFLNSTNHATILTIIPFFLAVLSLHRGVHFIDFCKTKEFKDLSEKLTAGYILDFQSLPMGICVVWDFFTAYSLVQIEDDKFELNKVYKADVATTLINLHKEKHEENWRVEKSIIEQIYETLSNEGFFN